MSVREQSKKTEENTLDTAAVVRDAPLRPPRAQLPSPNSSRGLGRGRPELGPSRLRDHGPISGLMSGSISGAVLHSLPTVLPFVLLESRTAEAASALRSRMGWRKVRGKAGVRRDKPAWSRECKSHTGKA